MLLASIVWENYGKKLDTSSILNQLFTLFFYGGGIDGIIIHLLSTSVMVTVASAGSTVTSLPLTRVRRVSLSSRTLSSRISMLKHLRLLLSSKTGSKVLMSV